MPDILVFCDGKTIGIELKAGTKVSPVQEEMFARLGAAGIDVSIARCIFDVEEILDIHKIPVRKFTHGQSFKTPKGRRPEEPAQGEAGTAA